jgi:hypothetical protein
VAVVMPAAPRFVFISLTGQGYPQPAAGGRQGVGASNCGIKKTGRATCTPGLLFQPCYAILRHPCYATLGVRLRELRWKNSAWLATADTIAGWNGLEIRKAGSGRSPVRKRSG